MGNPAYAQILNRMENADSMKSANLYDPALTHSKSRDANMTEVVGNVHCKENSETVV
jgi:hypothetical protein